MADSSRTSDYIPGLPDPFRRLVESVRDYGIFLLDTTGHVLTWNLGAEHLKGYAAHEILGRHISIFYADEARARRWPGQELEIAAAQGRFEDEGWRVRKDGTLFWANVIITALKDDRGQLRGFAKITRDLSDRRRQEDLLRQGEERFRLLIDSVKDYAIFMLDPEGRVVSWNADAERIKGYKTPEIIGRHFSVFYPEEARRRKWPEQELAMAREKGHFEDEGPRVRKDGSTFWANVVLSPLFGAEGELKGYAKVTRDLTDQKRVEALEKAEKQTNEFLAMLAHELRNPLAPIRNALQLLAKKPTADPAEIWVREVLQRQTVQMTRLVDDLLDASRVTRSTVSLSKMRLDLHKLVRDAVDAATQWVQMRHHHLTVSLPDDKLEIEADPVRLNQVIQNLLHNAAKFTPNGGKIEIPAAREGEHAIIGVRDNGTGMTPQLLKSAFELFKQGQQGIDRPEGGLGVGLTLAERLVALHGGSVEARSEGLGHGSEFIVRLPLQHGAPSTPAKEAGGESGPPVRRRPLVGHDNPDAPKPPRLRPG